tara:strand:- start:2245 stop:2499 length:255 start_codon:yes stop_codon:yes gene_type:complete
MKPYDVIIRPRSKERALYLLEENKIEFNVVRKATKPQIRTAIEDLFKIKVSGVNTRIAKEGKIAIVKLSPEDSAEDLSNRLGIL